MVRTHIGPGPGKYMLPPLVGYENHDPRKYRNPQYTMRIRPEFGRKDLGPGPKYNTEYMSAYGKAESPAYSVSSRPKDTKTFQGPGPAAYGIQNVPRMKEQRPPAYSLSFRHHIKKTYTTPGPNNYDIPTTIGPKVPDKNVNGAFSMSSRYPVCKTETSPGPAKYDPTDPDKYRNKQPGYSMSIKHRDLKGGTGPGPNNYYPQFPQKGGISFGMKTDNPPYVTPEDEMPCINK